MTSTGLPAAPRRARPPRQIVLRRAAFVVMLVAAVAWAFAWGTHGHDFLLSADLAATDVDRTYVVDASTGTLDLAGIEVGPGEVVEFVLAGSAGATHTFVLMGAAPGTEMDESLAANGDTVIRMRIPEDGSVMFTCIIPGHEGLHGSLVVGARN